mmetsp:Transcript_19221/g.29607  ORF Transcript_19221/g.29607 Transcript_19221/m.29607 type:complete len:514 (+) Transcript_19221:165-1706(+)|eukprot:CAMPEP_0195289662 /NCGR_PEP_ID=MMETSP0707-20130614/5844_1 /TAXON_ID=33640 /ORGANISM="Asterionellopsis glacialis, Strain CCMP134" /LENGTH=513 /DNA_ID=CAMNT_0040349689 /DNA_START=119 /DNA_END=1660 /DNA_ORIENTATION=+
MRFPVVACLILSLANAFSATTTFGPRSRHSDNDNSNSNYDRRHSSSFFQAAQDSDTILPEFASKDEYLTYLKSIATLPKGFATGTADGEFVSVEAPSIGSLPIRATVIHLTEGPTDNWAAVFTQNRFPGAPIVVGKQRLASGQPLHALVINNKVSNVCSGGDGVADAEQVCHAVAETLNLPGGSQTVFPSSTGIIGWRLPAQELSAIVPQAVQSLQVDNALNAATAIMTTDRYPKVRSKTLSNGARIVGIAKGAGMIEPNMATMLSYIMTDATVPKQTLQSFLEIASNESFNSISVDGDESTSDTVVLMASNQIDTSSDMLDPQSGGEFLQALKDVTQGLASDLVRNGEGTSHVMKVQITNFPGTSHEARRLGRHIVNSPLFKCAVSGNDPNTGRLAGAIGSFMGKFKPTEPIHQMSLKLGGRCIFNKGKFVLEGDDVERELSDHMKHAQLTEHGDYPEHQKYVEIDIDFLPDNKEEEDDDSSTTTTTPRSSATVLGSDLTNEYVAVNADYRS